VAKVLLMQPMAQDGIKMLRSEGLEIMQLNNSCSSGLEKEIEDADAILVRDGKVPGELIDKGKQLKVISRHGVGLEKIDIRKATERGIWVTYTPTANSVSVAEHVIGLIFALAKNLLRGDKALRQGNFGINPDRYGMELEGKTLSILGLGNVGRQLGKKAAYGLGMKVLGYDPNVDDSNLDPIIDLTRDWERSFKDADFVSVHMPLNDLTRGLIGQKEFNVMKKSAFFINCARSPIVKESELINALRCGMIAGAGIDVYDPSPPAKNHPLFEMDNVIVTPHSAACTHEALIKMSKQAAQGVIEVLAGKIPTWPANKIEKSILTN
jgi:D-3-phosphoglycerate dehydrogenase